MLLSTDKKLIDAKKEKKKTGYKRENETTVIQKKRAIR